ncbi:hypothetical protein LCI18_006341 [Fusarium solani-melongenae]|uniref:Uncharacterized protein n=1 Tax=Fusarium solani subsp. cucurbitae TaxID=2747967 RepID=A0ACD3Z3I2_FUSSC|nr:hypothetical protein LCI18_006341 [Fusarium solani-melongenae]
MPGHASASESPPQRAPACEDSITARRARKREQDRRSQRLSRQRTKSRIAHLEGVVAELQQMDYDEKVMALRKERDRLAADREALAQTLDTIEKALQARKATIKAGLGNPPEKTGIRDACLPNPDESDKADDMSSRPVPFSDWVETGGPPVRGSDTGQVATPPSGSNVPDLDCFPLKLTLPLASQTMNGPQFILTPTSWSGSHLVTQQNSQDPIIPFTAGDICDCSSASLLSSPRIQPLNFWRFANETLTEPTEPSERSAQINGREDDLEHDVPVRAVLEGWDAAQRRAGGHLTPSWRKLRRIDETLFSTSGKTERLAMLRVMHSLYRYHQSQSPERRALVPKWYLARPSQSVAHSYAIDYFAWPGLRERFVFYQHKYCGNLFWSHFCSDLRILWPFEFRDCYSLNVATGEYKISHAFDERIRDLRSWTMSSEMFQVWPEFLSDIPVYNNSLLPSLSAQPSGQPVFLGHDWGSLIPATVDSTHQRKDADAVDCGIGEQGSLHDTSLANLDHHLSAILDDSDLVSFEGSGGLLLSGEPALQSTGFGSF